jgi:hypothetical protein
MLTLTCQSCGTPITGGTLEELTANVQAHVQTHGHARPIRPEHIAARLKREQARGEWHGKGEHEHP